MKAFVLETVGTVDKLLLQEIEAPHVKTNEVLVKTKAISINPVDYKVRLIDGVLNMIYGEDRPAILGWDISGEVIAIGEDVTQFKIGDFVFGMVNFPGAGKVYAEQVVAPENHLAKMPEDLSFEDAAATTLAALTALQVLETRVKKGDKVLIHAGSGGVGHFAIQIAKHLGAYVIATSSAKNKDFVLSMGADEHIDYRNVAFEEVLSDIDFVLDGMSGDVLLNSIKVVKEGGAIISLPGPDFSEEIKNAAEKGKVDVSFLLVQSSSKDMNTLKDMLAQGILKAHVSHRFPFEKLPEAHTEIEKGRTVGKIVVTV